MPKNTFFLIAVLAIFAALVVGVNIGKKLNPNPEPIEVAVLTTPVPSATPTPALMMYEGCGILLTYPETLTKMDIETGGAMLVDSSDTKKSIAVACQKNIPRPPLIPEKVESMKIGSISATLYHDGSGKDGSPIDKLIFKHPKTGQDVYISGLGSLYNEIISTIVVQ